jgi:anaerobic selenocysteine-containing dehydrogenase
VILQIILNFTTDDTLSHAALSTHPRCVRLDGDQGLARPAREVAAARRRGAHVVTVDVRETEAAARSDEAIVLRPGTDAALALGLMHVIVGEGPVLPDAAVDAFGFGAGQAAFDASVEVEPAD